MAFWNRRQRSRSELLEAGDRARARGRLRAAAATYRKILETHGPDDPIVQGKLAPILARLKDPGAIESFRRAAEGHVRTGFLDRALAVYSQARELYPLETEFHSEAARLHLLRNRRADAVNVLVDGGRTLSKTKPADAVEMLRGALGMAPGHVEATLTIALLLRRQGLSDEARELLSQIEYGLRGAALRRVRWALFQTVPSWRTGWRLFLAVIGHGDRRAEPSRPALPALLSDDGVSHAAAGPRQTR